MTNPKTVSEDPLLNVFGPICRILRRRIARLERDTRLGICVGVSTCPRPTTTRLKLHGRSQKTSGKGAGYVSQENPDVAETFQSHRLSI
jgi:hypothetical protein